MTQIATAVTPSAIIIGADSAVLITIGGIRHPLVYTGVHKLFQWEAHGILVGMFGSFPLEVEGQPFDIWMRNWHKVGREQPLDLDGLLNQLTGDLNDKVRALLPAGGLMGLHVALWIQSPKWPSTKIPVVFKVSNETGSFESRPLLPDNAVEAVYRYRTGEDRSGFPMILLTDGLLKLDGTALRSWADEFTKLVGAQVPMGNVDGVLDYVRFFLRMVADLQRISGQPPLVAPPIETAVSLADPVSGFSLRL